MSKFKFPSKHDGLTWIESPRVPGEVICINADNSVVAGTATERKAAHKALLESKSEAQKEAIKDGEPLPEVKSAVHTVEPVPDVKVPKEAK